MQGLARVEKLQKMLKQWDVDSAIITKPVDLYYLTGIDMTAGTLLVSRESVLLFADGRYLEKCRKNTAMPVILDSTENRLNFFCKDHCASVRSLVFDSDATSYHAYVQLVEFVNEVVTTRKIPLELKPQYRLMHALRMVKDIEEQEKLRKACELCVQGYEYLLTQLKVGITEKKLVQLLEIFWLERGADGASFDAIIAFGKNSSMPHYRSQEIPLKEGDIVLLDIGVQLDHYCSDMTRVVFFGKSDPKLKEIAAIVQKAQEKAVSLCRPGVTTKELDRIAREEIERSGYGDYFTHGLGHGIGLEIHESPFLRKDALVPNIVLEPGMAVTIEPGIYIPDLGGVRIEDTVIVTEESCENLIPLSKDYRQIQP